MVIGLNITIAFAIDMYNSIERLEKSHISHEQNLYDLAMDMKREKQEEIERIKDRQREMDQFEDITKSNQEIENHNNTLSY